MEREEEERGGRERRPGNLKNGSLQRNPSKSEKGGDSVVGHVNPLSLSVTIGLALSKSSHGPECISRGQLHGSISGSALKPFLVTSEGISSLVKIL